MIAAGRKQGLREAEDQKAVRAAAAESKRLRAEDKISHALLTDANAEIARLRTEAEGRLDAYLTASRQLSAAQTEIERLKAPATSLPFDVE